MLSLISLAFLGLLGGAQAAFDMSKNTNVAVYWGQNTAGDQLQLSDYCKQDSIDTVIMSFLTDFNGTGGLPILNLADTCSKSSGTFKGSELANCSFLADQIKSCQANGKAVTLSLGGEASTVGFKSDKEATDTAQQMWDLFFGGGGNSTASPPDDKNITTLQPPDNKNTTTLQPPDDGDDTPASAFSRRVIRRSAVRRAERKNSTDLPPNDNNSTITPPGADNSTITPPGADNSTITPPGGDNSTIIPPGGDNSTITPPGSDNSTITPPGGDNSTITPPGGDNSTVTPPGGNNSTSDNSTISTSGGNIRPFGDAILDGIDLDIEQGSSAHWDTFVNAMRKLSQGSTKKFLVTGAPQCPIPDKFLSDPISKSDFDAIYIQFYNNPSCALDSKGFNFDQWDEFARTKAKNKNMKVYIGAPGDKNSAGSGVVGADKLQTLAVDSQKKFKSFGGVMFFDASTAFDNNRFDKTIKQALLTGKVTATNSTDSGNSSTTDPGNSNNSTATASRASATATLSASDPFGTATGTKSSDPPLSTDPADPDTTDPGAAPTDTLSAGDPFSTPADPLSTVVTADPTDPANTSDSVLAATQTASSRRPHKTTSADPGDEDTTSLPASTKTASSRRPHTTTSADPGDADSTSLPASTATSSGPSDPVVTTGPVDPPDDPTDDPTDPTDDPTDPTDPTEDPLDPINGPLDPIDDPLDTTDATPASTSAAADDPTIFPSSVPGADVRRSAEAMPRVVSRHFRLLRRSAWQA